QRSRYQRWAGGQAAGQVHQRSSGKCEDADCRTRPGLIGGELPAKAVGGKPRVVERLLAADAVTTQLKNRARWSGVGTRHAVAPEEKRRRLRAIRRQPQLRR